MSGILERMAKRAHGTLAGAEPLLASKFALAARGERDPLADVAGPLALHARLPREDRSESVFSPEATESRHGLGRHDAVIATARDVKPQARKRSGPELPVDADVSSTHLTQTAANLPAEDQVDSGSREVRRGSEIPASEARNAARALPRALSRTNADGPATGTDSPLIAANRDWREPDASVTPRADGQTRSAAFPAESHRRAGQEDGLAADEAGVRQKPLGAPRAGAAHSNGAAGDARSNTQPEEKTEIHISIGNIELRSPRAETRPQPAPFRPRVTLEEFLRRGSEAKR